MNLPETITKALERIPTYDRFLTVDEMFHRAKAVVEQHPHLAQYHEVGHSTDGEAIPMIEIGDGPKHALLFACPHPNEPIGAMLIQFLLDELVQNDTLRKGYTWFLLPCVDPDGTRLNEGWFAGPYTVSTYARNFYRPRSEEQVEWTFPINYKRYTWTTPIPETRALMQAIEQTKPDFIYSLHNAGFGGVYYYISQDVPDSYEQLSALPENLDLFLSLGEPEMPWAEVFSQAIYRVPTLRDAYDYFEQYASEPPETLITGGASSFEFAASISQPLSLVTELPYFQSPQVSDTSATTRTRGEVIREGIGKTREMFRVLEQLLENTRDVMTEDTRFLRAVRSFTEHIPKTLGSKEKWAEQSPEMKQFATVAQETDELYVGTFYRVLIASMLARAFDAQLQAKPHTTIERAQAALEQHLDSWIQEIEENLTYEPIPIRKLVQAQYGAMLIALNSLGR